MTMKPNYKLMPEAQKAAYHLGYLQVIGDLLDMTKKTPLLTQESLLKALRDEVLRLQDSTTKI